MTRASRRIREAARARLGAVVRGNGVARTDSGAATGALEPARGERGGGPGGERHDEDGAGVDRADEQPRAPRREPETRSRARKGGSNARDGVRSTVDGRSDVARGGSERRADAPNDATRASFFNASSRESWTEYEIATVQIIFFRATGSGFARAADDSKYSLMTTPHRAARALRAVLPLHSASPPGTLNPPKYD